VTASGALATSARTKNFRRPWLPGEILLHPGDIALEGAEEGDHLVEFAVVLLLLGADRAQPSQHQISALFIHQSSIIYGAASRDASNIEKSK
jgi:hypothetical protein